jgi:CspA family cold shock protein
MANGIVKWYSNVKGYGFLTGSDDEIDYFFRITEVRNQEALKTGEEVKFHRNDGPKGKYATDIEKILDHLS